jgi:predicted MFS family arabinose efflux permease
LRALKTIIFVLSALWLMMWMAAAVLLVMSIKDARNTVDAPDTIVVIVFGAAIVVAALGGAAVARASRPWVGVEKRYRSFRLKCKE